MKPIRPPWRALKESIPVDNPEDDPGWLDQTTHWKPPEVPLGDDRVLVLEFT